MKNLNAKDDITHNRWKACRKKDKGIDKDTSNRNTKFGECLSPLRTVGLFVRNIKLCEQRISNNFRDGTTQS